MGLFALGVLWLNTGLVLAVALKQLGNVRALKRRFARAREKGELVAGTALGSGRFAVRRITMTGRAITTKGPDRILFTDGPQSFEVLGGELEVDGGGRVVIEATQPAASEVWIDPARAAEGTACASAGELEQAFADASTFKGFTRDVELELRAGDRVWVYGAREGDRLSAKGDEPLVVSSLDPIAFCASRARLIVAFVVLAALALFVVTGLALYPPHFGVVSTIGGALGLAYFLAIQPLGTAVRDAVKTPARRTVGAIWQRPPTERASAR